MAPVGSLYSQGYNSFSGVDIKAVFASVILAELQAISYSVTREKAPIYTMGSPDPRSFSRGKRGIAGTLVFVMFDRHALLGALGAFAPEGGLKFQSDIDSLRPQFRSPQDDTLGANIVSASGVTAADAVQNQESPISTVGGDQALASPWYADQIPPFDITLAAANEYGHLATMAVVGSEILNEGYGISIDDISSEQQHTYVSRQIVPWTPVPSPNAEFIATQGGTSTGS